MNTITIVGRLTRKPELLTTSQGTEWVKFTIASDRRYFGKGERQTDFIDCSAVRSAKYIADYADKGSLVHLVGELQVRKATAQDGTHKTYYSVSVQDITLLSTAPKDKRPVEAPDPFLSEELTPMEKGVGYENYDNEDPFAED